MFIHTLCIYELTALHHRRMPTITLLTHRSRHTWQGRVVVGSLLGWLAFHLLLEQCYELEGPLFDGIIAATGTVGT